MEFYNSSFPRAGTISDVVVLVGIFVQRRVLDRVREFAPVVVAIGVAARLRHARTRARDLRAATDGVASHKWPTCRPTNFAASFSLILAQI